MRLRFILALASVTLSGCGAVGFEVGDPKRNEEIKAEHVIMTPPAEALKVVDGIGAEQANSAFASDAGGVLATYTYDSPQENRLNVVILDVTRDGCFNTSKTKPKFLWREIDVAGATVGEKDITFNELFAVKAKAHYNLIVDLETPRGRCKQLGVSFGVRRYPL